MRHLSRSVRHATRWPEARLWATSRTLLVSFFVVLYCAVKCVLNELSWFQQQEVPDCRRGQQQIEEEIEELI